MKKNVSFKKIKKTLENASERYLIKEHNLFYLSDKIRIHSLTELKKIEFLNANSIENVFQVDDMEVPTKLAFSLKKQYGNDISNLLLVRVNGNWLELWLEKIGG